MRKKEFKKDLPDLHPKEASQEIYVVLNFGIKYVAYSFHLIERDEDYKVVKEDHLLFPRSKVTSESEYLEWLLDLCKLKFNASCNTNTPTERIKELKERILSGEEFLLNTRLYAKKIDN